jgi:hypothetical protein
MNNDLVFDGSKISSNSQAESSPSTGAQRRDASTGAQAIEPKGAGKSDSGSGALFVTRPEEITEGSEWRIVAHGVDGLDIGCFVQWGRHFGRLVKALEYRKRKASGTTGILWKELDCIVLPSGKKPRYRWHVNFHDLHIFISKQSRPDGRTPNVYISLNSELLWATGVDGAIDRAREVLQSLGGTLSDVLISRCDPCVDVVIDGGLTYEFLKAHRVPGNRKENAIEKSGRLETYYNGAKEGDTQLRIYDKRLEVIQSEKKLWFFDLWGVGVDADVWRFEFQLRREALKRYGINSDEDLAEKLPGVWRDLTTEWFSLRNQDDSNTTRRSTYEQWKKIQDCAELFGDVLPVEVEICQCQACGDWFVSHIGGCLSSYGACKGIEDFDECLGHLATEFKQGPKHKSFADNVKLKMIKRGRKAA